MEGVTGTAATAVKRDTRFFKWMRKLQKERTLHFMILPSVICTIVFAYFPMYGILIAFKHYDMFQGVWGSPWADNYGFENFIDFFKSTDCVEVLGNTIAIALLKLALCSLPPVILAIMINEVTNIAFKRITQSISYLPHFVSWVVVGGLIMNFLSPNDGALNAILMQTHLIRSPIDFLSVSGYFWPIIILSDIWKGIGWGSIIYLGVIVGIDPNLYEVIDIDGGGRWAKIKYVTWPFLTQTFVILFILGCGKIMSGGGTFSQSYILGNPANRSRSDILSTYILRVGLNEGRFSFSTAVGLFESLVNLILLLLSNKVSKLLTDKGLF